MLPKLSDQQRNWGYVVGWTGLIYATLSIVRPICVFLKQHLPFAFLVNFSMVVLIVIVGWTVIKMGGIRNKSSYFILAAVMLAYGYALVLLKIPEEKIHLIEYGVLAGLSYNAIQGHIKTPAAYGYAWLLASALGWIDERIQYLLPNRYYNISDVILNCVSAALALMLVFIVRREVKND